MRSDRPAPPLKAAGRLQAVLGRKAVPALIAFALAFGSVPPLSALPQEEASQLEYEVKAVFLYHFTRYLQWPPESGTGSFEIAILGDSAIVEPLAAIAAKKTVDRRPILVRTIDDLKSIGRPHMLFVPRAAGLRLREVLREVGGQGILTVGEEEGLGEKGLAVNFVLREGAVKFEINEPALRESGIQPSSQLLKLAILVGGGR